jgi:hypothetical protein
VNLCLDELHRFLGQERVRTFATGLLPTLVCRDGFKMSVQASQYHYCKPQTDEGPWTHVEVGFPSWIEPLLWPYAESPGKWTDSVYPGVPVELVAAVVELHGGFGVQK